MLTYNTALDVYVRSLRSRNLRLKYIENVIRTLQAFTKYTPVESPEKLTPSNVMDYTSHLLSKNYADVTVKTKRGCILTWLSWLSLEGYIDDLNWLQRTPNVKCDERNPVFLNAHEIEKFLTTAQTMNWRCELTKRRNYALICTLIDTGLREAELIGLRMCDVDTTRRVVYSRAVNSKSRRDRVVWFSTETQNALRAYLKVRRKRRGEMFWVSRDRDSISKSTLLQVVHRIARESGIRSMTVHGLRHTCATAMRRNGMDVSGIAAVLGHSHIRTSMRYVHLVNEDVHEEYEKCAPLASHI